MTKTKATLPTLCVDQLKTVTGGAGWGLNSNGKLGYDFGGVSIGVDGKVGVPLRR